MKIKQVLNEKSSASSVKQLLMPKRNGRVQVRTFAIMTAENPHSKKLDDLSNLQYNKKFRKELEKKRKEYYDFYKGNEPYGFNYNKETKDFEPVYSKADFKNGIRYYSLSKIEKYLERMRLRYIRIKGRFSGNDENSYLILNISLEDSKYFASRYGQTSFFYCYYDNDNLYDDVKLVVSYYEEDDNGNYYKVNSTSIITFEDDDQDWDSDFSKVGDFKWRFPTGLFEQPQDTVVESFYISEVFDSNALEKSVDDAYSSRGKWIYRGKAYKSSV